MTQNPTNYLDLDAIEEAIELTIKLDGNVHKLVPITVSDFIANLQLVQKMGTTGDVQKETEILVEMLSRAFPTIGTERLWKLSITQLNQLMAKAQEFNGAKPVEEAKAALAEAGNENPPSPTS